MRMILAASLLALASAPLAAQPMNHGQMGGMGGMHDMGATPATPATPAVPADSPAASTLPPTTATTVDNALPPPPAAAMNKTYPLCTRTLHDNCQNPGEGGAPGRSRAADVKHRHHSR